ncbi:MAG: efflux RND transporter periplasmic adaptor subunit, partial [Betaproteobacteria bacterium]
MMMTQHEVLLRAAVVALALAHAPAAMAADAPVLRTAPVQYREVEQTLAAGGVVEAVKQATGAAEVAGRGGAVNFGVGDRVRHGLLF